MSLRYAPHEAVAGDPAALRTASDRLDALADEVGDRRGELAANTGTTNDFWTGAAGTAYRSAMDTELAGFAITDKATRAVADACDELAAALESARQMMAGAVAAVDPRLGGPRALLGAIWWDTEIYPNIATPPGLGGFQSSRHDGYWVEHGDRGALRRFMNEHNLTFDHFQSQVDQAALAFKTAREARVDFTRAVGGARGDLARLLYTEPTAAESAVDREIASGREGTISTGLQWLGESEGDLQDPQGRVILYRWGNPYEASSIVFHNDGFWAPYLMNNDPLSWQVQDMVGDLAKEAAQTGANQFDLREHAEIENGYSSGYGQLHGTEVTVGDFHVEGTRTVESTSDGGYVVTINGTYTWNDVIDPNSAYIYDTILSLGGSTGTPYGLHIGWDAATRVTLDRDLNVTGIDGYPGFVQPPPNATP